MSIAKQLFLQSVFRLKTLSELCFVSHRGFVSVSSRTSTFNVDPLNHPPHTTGNESGEIIHKWFCFLRTLTCSLRYIHVRRASQALQDYQLTHYVCMSTRVLGCDTTISAHELDAGSDVKHVKPRLTYVSSIESGLFRIHLPHNAILNGLHVHRPSMHESSSTYATLQNGKHESPAHVIFSGNDGKYDKHHSTCKSSVSPDLLRTQSPHNAILHMLHVHYTTTFKYLSRHNKIRNFCTETLEDQEDQPEISTYILKKTTDSSISQAVPEKMQVLENGIMLRQEESSEDDSLEESTDEEKEFYDLIEAEDSPDELLSMLINLEQNFPSSDSRICRTCLRLAQLCNDTNKNPEKILDYARKALHNFDSNRFPIESARSLFLVGIAHYKMGELKQAVGSLERCVLMMEKLGVPLAKQQELATLHYSVRIVLGQAKISLGWNHEGVLDFEKGVTDMEKILLPDSPRLASCYRRTGEAYMHAKKPKEALSLCKRALLIAMKCFGPSSSEVADIRSFMLQVYYELNDCENVLCECQLAGSALRKLSKFEEAMILELESMPAFFRLGRLREAVVKLNEIIKCTEEENPLHVEALIFLVRAFRGLKDDTAAAEYCQKALNALENKNPNLESAKTLVRLSVVYEQLRNYDQALAILGRALEFLKHSTEREAAAVAADVEGYIGFLLLSTGRPNEAVTHLESSIARKKNIYGPESGELLDVYNHIGVAYAHAKMVDEALAAFGAATMILDKSNDEADLTSIYIHNNLSLLFSLFGRIDEAIESKKHAINLMRRASKGISFSLDEAEEELEALVQATKHGKPASKSNEQMLKEMLTSCTQAHAIN